MLYDLLITQVTDRVMFDLK